MFVITTSKVKTLLLSLLDKIKFLTKIVKRLSFLPQVVTLIVAITTAIVSYMQWHAMKEQLTEMKLARKNEQRPFIVHSLQHEIIEPNKKISFDVTTTNYGKSPAMSWFRSERVFYGVNAKKNSEEWFEKFKGKPYDICGNSIIPPTDGNPFTYISVESDKIFNLKEYADFKNGIYPIIVVVKEYYSDMSCNGYSSETAISWQPNGALYVIKNNINNL